MRFSFLSLSGIFHVGLPGWNLLLRLPWSFASLTIKFVAKLPFHSFSSQYDDVRQHLQRLSDSENGHGEAVPQALSHRVTELAPEDNSDRASNEHGHYQEGLSSFDDVLAALDKSKLPQHVLSIRQRMQPQYYGKAPAVSDPTCGSYNLCFALTFGDNTRWLIRFPITGTKEKWSDPSSRALVAEAKTMMFLKKRTSIPLPDVFDFCATTGNEMNCPYIVMSYIAGYSLYHVLRGHHFGLHTLEENEKCRRRMLKGVASAAKQLSQFSSDKGGSLEFNDQGRPSGVGPLRMIDHKGQLDCWLKDDSEETGPFYFEAGPFEDPEDQYLSATNLRDEETADPMVDISKMVLRLVPENDKDEHQFDLAHPDFAPQNIIVSAEGELRGIIDWDGVAVVPLSVGSRRYPSWIIRDWDFSSYQYEESTAGGKNLRETEEDSPEALKHYRDLYRHFFAEAHPGILSPVSTSVSAELMRMSVVAGVVYTAAMEPFVQDEIMKNLLDKIASAAPEGVGVGFYNLYMAVEDEEVDDGILDDLEEAFFFPLGD